MTKASKRFYSLLVSGTEADLDIYGDIVSEAWSWDESDMNAYRLSQKLSMLEGVTRINVNINSYGGEVAEGIAIYNALRRHPAQIVTRCAGMACSIASVIFMAGDERIMYPSSMLMIHNVSTLTCGTAEELRKAADDTEKITTMSKAAYMEGVSITEEELSALMDAETWISPAEALNWGFATSIEEREEINPTQSARGSLMELVAIALQSKKEKAEDDEDDPEDPDGTEAEPEDDPDDPDQGDDPDPEDPDPDEGDGQDPEDDPEEDDDEDEKKSEQACRSFFMAAFK